jgi:hypothetical protein
MPRAALTSMGCMTAYNKQGNCMIAAATLRLQQAHEAMQARATCSNEINTTVDCMHACSAR